MKKAPRSCLFIWSKTLILNPTETEPPAGFSWLPHFGDILPGSPALIRGSDKSSHAERRSDTPGPVGDVHAPILNAG
ncbi:hypothetical protein EYF80_049513 [Liparis tanakae]|uniref:Uncharacterized protein n=1 Tax=Liparis tanakae TaxID=230148 RepID=A0A4Z2FGI8_9TELE|nr:hypothetical protein EYF80_049513 [Liparis tanakae]